MDHAGQTINRRFGGRLESERIRRGLSHAQLAHFIEDTYATLIADYESGNVPIPACTLYQFAEFFGMSMDEFIGEAPSIFFTQWQFFTAFQSLSANDRIRIMQFTSHLASDVPIIGA